MKLQFNEFKATQAATYLLEKLCGNEYYLKIIKLLYLADRKAINDLGLPITGDHYVSMKYGPVLTNVLDLINFGPLPSLASYWHNYIASPEQYKITLLNAPGIGKLNQLEVDILDQIVADYGHLDRWELVKLTHSLPEYKNTHGSAIPIEYEDIYDALKKSPTDIKKIINQVEFASDMEELFRDVDAYTRDTECYAD